METILILIGVGCIIGAIIGGGVKLVQIELSPVASLWRQGLLAVFGIILVISGMAAGGHLSQLLPPKASPPAQSIPPSPKIPETRAAPGPSEPPKQGKRIVAHQAPAHRPGTERLDKAPTEPQKSCALEGSIRSAASPEKRTIIFVNKSARPIKTYWLDYDGKRINYSVIPPNTSQAQESVLSHPWLVTDADGTCLGIWMAGDTAIIR